MRPCGLNVYKTGRESDPVDSVLRHALLAAKAVIEAADHVQLSDRSPSTSVQLRAALQHEQREWGARESTGRDRPRAVLLHGGGCRA